jgi:hypothetical protein
MADCRLSIGKPSSKAGGYDSQAAKCRKSSDRLGRSEGAHEGRPYEWRGEPAATQGARSRALSQSRRDAGAGATLLSHEPSTCQALRNGFFDAFDLPRLAPGL